MLNGRGHLLVSEAVGQILSPQPVCPSYNEERPLVFLAAGAQAQPGGDPEEEGGGGEEGEAG